MKIVDSYGNELGYQQGEDYVINGKYGNRLGWINGLNDIINTYGTKVGEIRSNGVFDIYGSRVGDINGDNIISLLVVIEPPVTSSDDGGWIAIVGGLLIGAWSIIKFIFEKLFILFIWHFGDGGFKFKGTANRKEWWKKILLGLLAIFLCFFIFGLIAFGLLPKVPSIVKLIIVFVSLLLSIVPLIAVSVRRMHDIGKAGWFAAIPIVNFIFCGFFPGVTNGNKYI